MVDKDVLVLSLATREAIDQGCRNPPPQQQPQDPYVGGRGSEGGAGAGRAGGGGGRDDAHHGQQHGFATLFATREDMSAALRAERPPAKSPKLPHYHASDVRVSKTVNEATRSEHTGMWEDSVAREFRGLLDKGSFEPV